MLSNLLTREVTILTAGTQVDRYNNTILDWTAATSTPARAWIAQSNASREDQQQRDAVVTSLIATFAAGTPIGPYDRVLVDGVTYEVDGKPNVAYTPRGAHHVEVQLRAVEG